MAAKYTVSGGSRDDLLQASVDRQRDAGILFDHGRFGSAIAMGLYSLEMLLKAKICFKLDRVSLPKPFETHELDSLLVLSGLEARMGLAQHVEVKANWDHIVTTYGCTHVGDLRYLPNSRYTMNQAKKVLECLQLAPSGVLIWLRHQP